MMKAAMFTAYGGADKLAIQQTARPTPTAKQVLVRVVASSLNPLDWKLRSGELQLVWPLQLPYTAGFDLAGVVTDAGGAVKRWKVGDPVFACLMRGGGHAEWAVIDEDLCVAKPPTLSFEQCAAAPVAAVSALQSLRNIAKVTAGQRVLVNGASGGVGSYAVQIAKALECHVTGVCSTRNVEFTQSLGADEALDYAREDVLTSGPYDVFFDVVPNQSFARCRDILTPRGIYVTTLPSPRSIGWSWLTAVARPFGFRKRCASIMLKPNRDDLQFIADLMAEKRVTSVISHEFSLEEIREAYAQIETGHTRGKIVIRISEP